MRELSDKDEKLLDDIERLLESSGYRLVTCNITLKPTKVFQFTIAEAKGEN